MIIRIFLMATIFLASCGSDKHERSTNKYEDIKGLFASEAIRLNKLNPKIDKTVARNNAVESKKGITIDWKNELNLFSESDINKPAWKNSYKISGNANDISYTALDSNLRTRLIHLKKDSSGRLMHVFIVNKTHNYLYQSSEELSYIPDSIYKIVKKQNVILMGTNQYEITGVRK